MNLNFAYYANKLRHCFIGKCVGGTLGMPYEGVKDLLNLNYYNPVPTEMVGNDDLDLQIIWLDCIRRRGLPINSKILAEGWMDYIRSVWDEYGVAQRNIRKKIFPPLSGKYDNKFTAGFGAAIRTEIWAALAPGNPDLAVKFAIEDSTVDHDGDGVDATKFIAAFESLAYIESDINKIYDKAISYVSKGGRLYNALEDTKKWAEETDDFVLVRQKIIEKYGVQNFTDVTVNIPFVLLGLISGKGDFDKTLCNTVNCGYDTDCTGGIVGAIMGILSPECIGEKWTAPIGNKLVLSLFMVGTHQAETIDEMCMQIASLCCDVQKYYDTEINIVNPPEFEAYIKYCHKAWRKKDLPNRVLTSDTSVLSLNPIYLALKYPTDTAISLGSKARYKLEIISELDDKTEISLFMPYGFKVIPETAVMELKADVPEYLEIEIEAPYLIKHNYVEMLDITVTGNSVKTNCTAGIPVKDEWLEVYSEKLLSECPSNDFFKDAKSRMEPNHFFKVPKGVHYYSMDFKSPLYINDAIIVAEGTRKIKVWIDKELVIEAEDDWYVPASHRDNSEKLNCRKRINIEPKWHNIVIEVQDGEEGEIFFALFKPYGHEWLEDIETKKAFENI